MTTVAVDNGDEWWTTMAVMMVMKMMATMAKMMMVMVMMVANSNFTWIWYNAEL